MTGTIKSRPNDGGASRMRMDNSDTGSPVVGFIDQDSGQAVPAQGQGNMLLVKDQPVIEQLTQYWSSSSSAVGLPYAPVLAGCLILPEINVENYSRVRLVVQYRPGITSAQGEPTGSLGILTLLPEGIEQLAPDPGGVEGQQLWVSTGVVNPQLNIPPAPPYTLPLPIQNGYARRSIWSSELTWNWFEGRTAPFPYSPDAQALDLLFDVQSLTAWRLRVGDREANPQLVSSPASLNLYYQLQR